MKVAIDTTTFYITRAGTTRYLAGLLSGFAAISPPDLRLQPIAWPVENFGYRQPARMLKTAFRELVWAHVRAPSLLRGMDPDLLHSPMSYFLAPPPRARSVITICDLALMDHPERYRPWQKWSGMRRLAASARADRVICISRFTADQVIRKLGVPAGKIDVTHLATDLKGNPDRPLPPGIPAPDEFFLFVGSLEPGKNLDLLRRTYALAAASGRSLPPLLIVGARWEGVSREGPPPPGWHYLGRQPDEVLAGLYARAKALLFPSKYEGFGLPILEAMGLGCPVVCSPVASMPEVAGDAALFAPQTPEGYLEAIRRLLSEPDLHQELKSKGLHHARGFSWERCARQTLESYHKALA